MLSVHAYYNGRGFSFEYDNTLYEFVCTGSATNFLNNKGYTSTSYIIENTNVVGVRFFCGNKM